MRMAEDDYRAMKVAMTPLPRSRALVQWWDRLAQVIDQIGGWKRVYDQLGLNDQHIETAFKRMMKEEKIG